MLRIFIGLLFTAALTQGQGCDPDPCVNGRCVPDPRGGDVFRCECDRNWAGNLCSLPQPEVVCGNKSIEIFIDKRIVTEQGLPGSSEFVHFMDSPGCVAKEQNDIFYLKVDAPFKDCGVEITHDGNDYAFFQRIVWNRLTDAIERPLVLLNFTCTYEDKYTVSFGEITPLVTAVDFETSFGTFKVDMNFYKDSSFAEEGKFGVRPLVTIGDSVCVSTELKNVMPQDLVLTNRRCWASTEKDGSGTSHYLVSDKCQDDPTTEMISNGESDFARFCFQMFKWKDAMDEVYLHCVVNVCNVTAYPDYCQCVEDRTKRSARSTPEDDSTKITIGPIYPVPENQFNQELPDDVMKIEEFGLYNGNPKSDKSNQASDSKTTILIAVGVVLVISLILLGVVVAVYINCRRRSRDTKTNLRTQGEPVVIPNPSMHNQQITPNI